jgi:hypothetical protein
MKHPIMKCARWRLQWRSCLICVPAAMLFFVLSAQAQTDAILPPLGGSGGGQFIARCPQGQLLTGFELRTGDDVDAIRPLCITAYEPAEVGPIERYPSKFGGDGGGDTRQLVCPRDAPIVTGMFVYSEGFVTEIVNNIHLFCGLAATTQTPSEFPAAVFDGPFYNIAWRNSYRPNSLDHTQRCPAGLVAVGINGRSGIWLDSAGI